MIKNFADDDIIARLQFDQALQIRTAAFPAGADNAIRSEGAAAGPLLPPLPHTLTTVRYLPEGSNDAVLVLTAWT